MGATVQFFVIQTLQRTENRVSFTYLLERIGVARPYFNLEDMYYLPDEDRLTALAAPELPFGFERGPMTCGDIGRHGAIAGLAAIALGREGAQRHFYLATKAEYRAFGQPYAPSPLTFDVKVTQRQRRRAAVQIDIYRGEVRVADLSVDYVVLSKAAFGGFLRPALKDTFGTADLNAVPQFDQEADDAPYDATLAGTLERFETEAVFKTVIPTSVGRGHFDVAPALPVAVTFAQFSNLVGALLERPFRTVHAGIEASDFVLAGAEATFRVVRKGQGRFDCDVISNGKVKSTAYLEVTEEVA